MTSYVLFLGVIYVYRLQGFVNSLNNVRNACYGLYSFDGSDLLQFSSPTLVDPHWTLIMVLLLNMEQTGMLNLVGVYNLPKFYITILHFCFVKILPSMQQYIHKKLFDGYQKFLCIFCFFPLYIYIYIYIYILIYS